MSELLKQLATEYDWIEAFGYAGDPEASCARELPTRAIGEAESLSTDPILRQNVVEIAGLSAGENDYAPWFCIGRVSDGRWFSLEAWCDYTGWDCKAGGSCQVAATREAVIRFGTSAEGRKRMGLQLAEELQ